MKIAVPEKCWGTAWKDVRQPVGPNDQPTGNGEPLHTTFWDCQVGPAQHQAVATYRPKARGMDRHQPDASLPRG